MLFSLSVMALSIAFPFTIVKPHQVGNLFTCLTCELVFGLINFHNLVSPSLFFQKLLNRSYCVVQSSLTPKLSVSANAQKCKSIENSYL